MTAMNSSVKEKTSPLAVLRINSQRHTVGRSSTLAVNLPDTSCCPRYDYSLRSWVASLVSAALVGMTQCKGF
jgi:hypothetical protein